MMKRRHLQNRSAAAIGAVLIPVVSNLNWKPEIYQVAVDVAKIGASLIGLLVALILAIEGAFTSRNSGKTFEAPSNTCSHRDTVSKTVWSSLQGTLKAF